MYRGGNVTGRLRFPTTRFTSEGVWEPWTFEANDGNDSVCWAAALPGPNGFVGMFGVSYFGDTQWMLFVTGINEWREEQEWPLSRAVETELHDTPDG